MTEIKLEVDDQEINLNAFVRTFIEKTVLGMVTSLSGVPPEPRKIVLTVQREVPKGKSEAEKMRDDIWEYEEQASQRKAKGED